MSNRNAVTNGAHHIGLTVPNLQETQSFFKDILNFELLGEIPEYPAAFLSDGTTMITLWQAIDPPAAIPFDRKNVVGLHHLALTVEGNDQLNDLYSTLLKTAGVVVEFSPENLGEGPTRHFIVSIPSGIRIEFIAPAQ